MATTLTVTASAGNPARPLQKKSSGSHITTSVGMVSMAGGVGKASTVVTSSSDKNTANTKSVVSALPSSSRSSNPPILSQPPNCAPVLIRSSSAGSATLSTASSGAVRKLFVTPAPQPMKPPLSRANGPPKTIQSRSNSKTALMPDPISTSNTVESSLKPVTSQSIPPPSSTAGVKTISYSRIIASQESSRSVPHNEMIEQPVQQIMKTPTIFQEPATQITKPKKISTYSDAVGKKHQSLTGSANSAFASDIVGTGRVTSGSYSVAIPSAPLSQSSKMNLAPGARHAGGVSVSTADAEKALLADKSQQQQQRSSGGTTRSGGGWTELIEKSSHEYSQQQSYEDDGKEKLSPPSAGLGPIGPPSK